MNTQKNTTEQENFKQIYNIVDWIDLGLVGVIIFYYGRLISSLLDELPDVIEFDYELYLNLIIENANFTGIALVVASLIICLVFIYLTVKMRKKRYIGIVRTTARMIWNGFWLLLDVSFLFMIL